MDDRDRRNVDRRDVGGRNGGGRDVGGHDRHRYASDFDEEFDGGSVHGQGRGQ